MLRLVFSGLLLLGMTLSSAVAAPMVVEQFPCGLDYPSSEYDIAERQHYEDTLLTSPDHKWQVVTEETNGPDWQQDVYRLSVVSKVYGITRTITFSETLGAKYGFVDGVVRPEFWTRDSRFVYVRVAKQRDGPGVFIEKGEKLIRLEPITGKIQTLLEGDRDGRPEVYAFAVSPDGQYLASIALSASTPKIVIRSLKTGHIRGVMAKIAAASHGPGELVWSPKGSRIAFVVHEGDEQISGWVLNLQTERFERLWVGTRSRAKTYVPGWYDDIHVIIADLSSQVIGCRLVRVK